MRRTSIAPILAFLVLFLTSASGYAQFADGPLLNSSFKPADLRVSVNMTLVPVTVLDNMGRGVTGLTSRNFRVLDNSHPVTISSFAQVDQTVAAGLVFDCSRSMLTKLLDGVHLALAELKRSHLPRKALVVVSDGGDNNSLYSLRKMEKIVMEADAQIFTILLCEHPATQEELRGLDLMRRLAYGFCTITGSAGEITNAVYKRRESASEIFPSHPTNCCSYQARRKFRGRGIFAFNAVVPAG